MILKNIIGSAFHRLTVLDSFVDSGRTICKVRCSCGVEKSVRQSDLRSGRTKSCGCLSREVATVLNTKHGMRATPGYDAWVNMKRRSTNPKSKDWPSYGGRGITCSDSWLNLENFLADMGQPEKGMQLDRIDNDKGYSKENCRWTTPSKNQRNKRNTVFIMYQGKSIPLSDASDLSGIHRKTLSERMKMGDTGGNLFRPVK